MDSIESVLEGLKYKNIIATKKDSFTIFRMRNKQNKVITALRCYTDENFNPKSEWYSTDEVKINQLISDYNYVVGYRLDCQ